MAPNFMLAMYPIANTAGRLEIIGNTAGVQIGQLENAVGGTAGVRETFSGKRVRMALAPLIVTGPGPLATARVQLQDPTEVAANTGTNGGDNLTGDGMALDLDLSAITTSQTLTLIDNRTTDAITGFFEKGTTKNLYEEGEVIPLAGFDGTVTISYVGGTGNDVTLSLVALGGDYNRDGTVNSADYVVWRKIRHQRPTGLRRLASQLRHDSAKFWFGSSRERRSSA